MKKLSHILIFLMIMSSVFSAFSQEQTAEEKKKKIIRDHLLFNSSQGREFMLAIPPNEVTGYQLNAIEIYVTAAKKTQVTLSNPGMGVNISKPINPMQITTFSSKFGEITDMWECRESEMVMDKGIRLIASQPMSAYVLNAKPVTSDGYMGMPTSSWGTEYIHCAYYDFCEIQNWASGFIVLGNYDNTKIRIDLRGRGKGYATTVGGRDIGDVIKDEIGPGQTFMVRGNGLTRGQWDMTGSKITANKPIGLISFHMRTIIPAYNIWNGRDHMCEMLTPVQAWGKKYYTIEYKRDKGQGDFFRVVASQPNTRFRCRWYDLNDDKLLGNWEMTLKDAGDFGEYLETYTVTPNEQKSIRGASVWEADKPVLVMQYSYSADWDGNEIFDPFMCLVTPKEQYIQGTVFQTPSNSAFVNNYFNIIAVGDTTDPEQKKLQTVTIDGKPIYNIEGGFLYNRIPGTDLYWAKIQVQPGAHALKGETTFGGYIYGFSNFDSYGWPAAMAINKLDELDTLEPVLELTELCGNYTVLATEKRNGGVNDNPRQVDLGVADIQLLDGSFNYELVMGDLIPYPPVYEFTFELKVTDPFKPAYALFAVTDRAGNTALDSVRYEPDSLSLNPNPIVFGNVRKGTDKDIVVKLKNISDSIIKVTKIYLKTAQYYKVIGTQVPPEIFLQSGEERDITVRYSPLRESTDERDLDWDSLMVETECLKFKWPVSGRGVIPRIYVEDWDAGSVSVGSTVCKTAQTGKGLRIENRGTMPLTITSVQGVASPFTLSSPTVPPLPLVIEVGGIVFLQEICFESLDTSAHSINVTFKSDADPNGSDSVSNWMGRGLNPGPYITSKDWERRRVATINDSVVVIRNSGNTPVYVTGINLRTNNPNFRINKAQINPPLPFNLAPETDPNSTIKEIVVPVTYEPTNEGDHTVEIVPEFTDPTITPGSIFGTLKGFGFLPKIEVIGYEFIPAILVNQQHPDIGYVTIKSTSTSADLYVEKVEWSPTSQNPADFKWDMSQNPILTDFTIKMGDSVKLPVIFTATGVLERRATVNVISDAAPGPNVDPRITTSADVIGNAYETGIIVDSIDYGSVLLCDEPVKPFTVTNTSTTTAANVLRLEWISGDVNSFEILNQPPVTIAAKGSYQFQVKFKPSRLGPHAALLRVVSDVDTGIVLLEGSGYNVDVKFSMDDLKNMAPGMYTTGGTFPDFPVKATSGYWAYASITKFTIEVKYKSGWMAWNGTPNSVIKNGNALDNSWTVTGNEVKDPATGETTLTISGSGSTPIMKDGDICLPVFQLLLSDTSVYTPWYGDIHFDTRDKCVIYTTDPGSIELSTCVQDLRNIVYTGDQFYLKSIEPNPVDNTGFNVNFSVAFEGKTTLELVNSNGETIQTIFNEVMKNGEYTHHVNTNELSSGVYFLRMKSGPFSSTERVVIAK